jgi:hypothetical protein
MSQLGRSRNYFPLKIHIFVLVDGGDPVYLCGASTGVMGSVALEWAKAFANDDMCAECLRLLERRNSQAGN